MDLLLYIRERSEKLSDDLTAESSQADRPLLNRHATPWLGKIVSPSKKSNTGRMAKAKKIVNYMHCSRQDPMMIKIFMYCCYIIISNDAHIVIVFILLYFTYRAEIKWALCLTPSLEIQFSTFTKSFVHTSVIKTLSDHLVSQKNLETVCQPKKLNILRLASLTTCKYLW